MFRNHRFFIGFVCLVLLASGCSKTASVVVESSDSPGSKNLPVVQLQVLSANALSLAPILPGTQIPVVSAPSKPSRKGLIALDSPAHDFGEVRQNTQLRHDFVLTNNVNVPIRIVGMQSSCSCTWSESNNTIEESDIVPGQKVDYPVFINTCTYQDKASGKIIIIYRYQSDNPQWEGEEILALEVTATILPDYRIDPLNLSFGEIRALESQTATRWSN